MCSGRASNWEMTVKVKGACSKREEQKMNVKQKEANADVRRKKHQQKHENGAKQKNEIKVGKNEGCSLRRAAPAQCGKKTKNAAGILTR